MAPRDQRVLVLEIALLLAFFLTLGLVLLGVAISFGIVAAEYTEGLDLTDAEEQFFQSRQYFLVYFSLAVPILTLGIGALSVRRLARRWRREERVEAGAEESADRPRS